VNQVVSKRMVKKQQMAWTERGAHFLLRGRTQTLNGDLEETLLSLVPAVPVRATAATEGDWLSPVSGLHSLSQVNYEIEDNWCCTLAI
jgi:hypothetical protein